MARPKTVMTKKQAAKHQKECVEKHNEKRRAQYMFDAEYRKRVYEENRVRYREKVGVEVRNPLSESEVIAIAVERQIAGSASLVYTLDISEMATALGGYHPYVITRWLRSERFPKPNHPLAGHKKRRVYTLDAAVKLVAIMREHLITKSYLSNKDTETIAKLFNAID